MSMRQKGIKNVNKNDRSGPEAPNTTHSGLRWMNSRKSGNLALLMKPQPEHYTTLKRPWTFRFKKLSGLYLCWCHYIFFPPTRKSGQQQWIKLCVSVNSSIHHDRSWGNDACNFSVLTFYKLHILCWFEGWDCVWFRVTGFICFYQNLYTCTMEIKILYTLQMMN